MLQVDTNYSIVVRDCILAENRQAAMTLVIKGSGKE
jgi:hypothetical protein